MDYIVIEIKCDAELSDILVAELSELGFDSFLENENGLDASCPQNLFDKDAVHAVFEKYKQWSAAFSYEYKEVPKVNWNEEWEKNYDPIFVDNDIYVRATFHEPKPEFKYQIVIDPKMSFGTGHHATTSMMLCNQLQIPHKDKSVLDAGTGTGILAIMAEKLGAKVITANDVDTWCIENSLENINLNDCHNITVLHGA
ncbi:MAG TPA: 50S ribosomal protein L11 methyltransferase, partial [Cytophagales bacterium]|nr:50S ribosomal protein L11 methyltransferase [Cytophagales bacterium]